MFRLDLGQRHRRGVAAAPHAGEAHELQVDPLAGQDPLRRDRPAAAAAGPAHIRAAAHRVDRVAAVADLEVERTVRAAARDDGPARAEPQPARARGRVEAKARDQVVGDVDALAAASRLADDVERPVLRASRRHAAERDGDAALGAVLEREARRADGHVAKRPRAVDGHVAVARLPPWTRAHGHLQLAAGGVVDRDGARRSAARGRLEDRGGHPESSLRGSRPRRRRRVREGDLRRDQARHGRCAEGQLSSVHQLPLLVLMGRWTTA